MKRERKEKLRQTLPIAIETNSRFCTTFRTFATFHDTRAHIKHGTRRQALIRFALLIHLITHFIPKSIDLVVACLCMVVLPYVIWYFVCLINQKRPERSPNRVTLRSGFTRRRRRACNDAKADHVNSRPCVRVC